MSTHRKLISVLFLLLCVNQSWALHKSTKALQSLFAKICHVPKRVHHTHITDKTDLPTEVKSILDTHTREIQELSAEFSRQGIVAGGAGVRQMEWLPDWYIKYGIARYVNAHRIKAFIEQNKLTLVSMANKFLYHVPERPYDLSLVIAQKASGNHIAGWHLLNAQQ